jgi:site-specific DNA-methyltransferase (adenine-specific)
MTPRWSSVLTGSQVFEADCRTVAATLPDGVASLAILDGPDGMSKADWDRVPRGGTLGDLYAGHLDDVGRVCGPSASLYLWNTSAGWAELHPLVLARGWVFRSLIVWSKPDGAASKSAHEEGARAWVETMEVCGFYQREAWAPNTCAGQEIAYSAGRDERNTARLFLCEEWAAAGLRRGAADLAMGTNGMAGHYFSASQWSLPTWEAYQTIAAYAQAHGAPRDRPYLVHPTAWPDGGLRASYDHLRASYDHLRAEYDHLRAEYEASRPVFVHPRGVSNIWEHPQVSGKDRLVDADGCTLHPCQKPLLFAERMIRASSRPGDTVWVPFGGTLRELVAAERIARSDPGEARRVVTCEINQDGRDYIGAALEQVEGRAGVDRRQVSLFGGAG